MSLEKMSNLQRAIFLRFMNTHKALVVNEKTRAGKGRQAANKNVWLILATILNLEKNGIMNTAESWEKIWNEWKNDVKIKYRMQKKNLVSTGGGSPVAINLHYLDDQLIKLLEKNNEDLILPPPEDWEMKALSSLEKSNLPCTSSNKIQKEPVKAKGTAAKNNRETLNSSESESDDLIIVEIEKPAPAKQPLPNIKLNEHRNTVKPRLNFLKRKAPLTVSDQLSSYQRCKLKILNDNMKIQQDFLENYKSFNDSSIQILSKIADGFAAALEGWKEIMQ